MKGVVLSQDSLLRRY